MNKLLIFILVCLTLSCSEDNSGTISTDDIYFDNGYNKSNDKHLPVITFEEKVFDFGIILEGEKVQHTYSFTNTGKKDLILSGVTSECGCTTPKDFSREPIKSGEKGSIFIEFDSTNRAGKISKDVTVVTNCIPNKSVISITGEVLNTENITDIQLQE